MRALIDRCRRALASATEAIVPLRRARVRMLLAGLVRAESQLAALELSPTVPVAQDLRRARAATERGDIARAQRFLRRARRTLRGRG